MDVPVLISTFTLNVEMEDDKPVRRPVLFVRGLFQWAFDEYLAVLPAHHPEVEGLGAVGLDVFVDAESAEDA